MVSVRARVFRTSFAALDEMDHRSIIPREKFVAMQGPTVAHP